MTRILRLALRPSPTLLLTLLCAPALAAGGDPGASPATPQERDWVVLPLPVEVLLGRSTGNPTPLDGRHLFLTEEPAVRDRTLGPLVPGRAAEEVVWRAVQDVEGTSATVDALGDSLLIRGSSAARAAGTEALRALSADLEALHFDIRATLIATTVGGDQQATQFDETRRARSGASLSFGARKTTSFLADYDVEVASEIAIANPVIGTAVHGETLHLWLSSFVDEVGERRVFVQGLLDIAQFSEGTQFDPDVYELGSISQPVVRSTQVMFAGAIDGVGGLVVKLSGVDGELTERVLRLRTVPPKGGAGPGAGHGTGTAGTGSSSHARIVDLGRGLWRGRLVTPHAAFGSTRGLDVGAGPSPASLTQLFFATVGRTPGARPVLGEAIVIFEPSARGTASALRTLAGELDPTGTPAVLRVTMAGLTVEIPATEGTLLRVAHTSETSYVSDYDPQIANTAALSDPVSQIAISGVAIEGVLRGGVLMGRGVDQSVSMVTTRAAVPADVGRIQLPLRTRSEFPLRVRAGEVQRPTAGMTVEWRPRDVTKAPR